MSRNEEAMRRLVAQIEATTAAIFEDVGMEAQRSIVEGSDLTGAPGQPVDTGFLKGSWQRWYQSPTLQTIGTNVAYAPAIEDGTRASYDPRGVQRPKDLTQGGTNRKGPSTVGGSHSVAHTLNGLQRILDVVTKRHGGR